MAKVKVQVNRPFGVYRVGEAEIDDAQLAFLVKKGIVTPLEGGGTETFSFPEKSPGEPENPAVAAHTAHTGDGSEPVGAPADVERSDASTDVPAQETVSEPEIVP